MKKNKHLYINAHNIRAAKKENKTIPIAKPIPTNF